MRQSGMGDLQERASDLRTCRDCGHFKEPEYAARPGGCHLNPKVRTYSNSGACEEFEDRRIWLEGKRDG